MNIILYMFVFTTQYASCLITLDNFLLDFLQHKNLKFVYFYTCYKSNEHINISKITSSANTQSSFVKPTTNYEINKKLLNLGFVIDVSCQGYYDILKQAGENSLYQSHYKWLIIDTNNQVLKNDSAFEALSNIGLRVDSDVTIASYKTNNITFYDVYSIDFNRSNKLIITCIGFWTQNKKIIFTYNLSTYVQRKNLSGVLFKAAIINTHLNNLSVPVDEYYQDLSKKNYDVMSKVHYALMMHIRELHNFTLELILTHKWFGNIIGGMDDGIAKLLYEKTIDFGVTSGLIKTDRIPLYDFVSPTYPFRTCFIFRNPGTSGKIHNEFLRPFVTSVWFYILGYILLFCGILRCAFFVEKLMFNDNVDNTWSGAYLLTWAVFCQQGTTFIPKPASGKCMVLSLLVMSLLLYNYYTSSIVSSLLSGLPPPFTTIEELTNSDLDVGVEDVVYMRTLFEVSNDSRIKHLYRQKVLDRYNKPSYVKLNQGIQNVKTGGYAYHTEPTNGYKIIEQTFELYEICDLAEINVFQPTVLWVFAQKHSQYTNMLGVGYLKMLEAGIIFRQRKMWVTEKPACLANTHLVEVGIQQLSPAFLVLLFGLCLGIVFLILEKGWKKYKPRISYHLLKFKF